jgi:2-oxoglutarate ferredoxin oxidoreductase subunit gamma
MRNEIRIAGTGGMGVVLAGVILGHAAVVYGGLDAVQTQSYGSEARGTAAKSEVIISSKPIKYPKVRKSDFLVAMSQKAFDLYASDVKDGSIIIIDEDIVDASNPPVACKIIKVPAMRTADNLGRRMIANMVMLGALIKISGLIEQEAIEKAVADMVPANTIELNKEAIETGSNLV